MRKIKFRAWDEDLGMSEPFNLEGAGIMFLEGGNPDSIMQYTGLKDKNGKEIYEGDIVKTNGYKSTALIEFDYLGVTKKVMTPKGERNYSIFHDGEVIKDVLDDVEVIGNIYESPELLKKVIRWH